MNFFLEIIKMSLKRGQSYKFIIKEIIYGGHGIAKMENFSVIINNVVPGDIVEALLIKKKKKYAKAKVLNFLRYSSHRITPKCSFSEICGGCKWQFINYNKQLFYKQKNIIETIHHISKLKNSHIEKIIPSENIFGYRNKMDFSCSNSRWIPENELQYKSIKSNSALGLHISGTFNKVLDISNCLIMPRLGNQILKDAKKFMEESKLPFYDLKKHYGFWRFIVLRYSFFYDEWLVDIITSKSNIKNIKLFSKKLKNKHTKICSVLNTIVTERSGRLTKCKQKVLFGSGKIREKIGKYNFNISSNSFFQTNTITTEKLYEIIKSYCNLSGKETILDLYCGTGSISIYISEMAKKIIGFDMVASSIEDAKNNCKINLIKNCKFILGDVKDKLSKISLIPDIVILDPPRVGIHQKVIKQIIDIRPNKIIYVSCNPTTFARDLIILKKYYFLNRIQPVDMFPHTFHIEIVCELIKIK